MRKANNISEWIEETKLEQMDCLTILENIYHWDIYSQEGPSDETLLVNEVCDVAISSMRNEIFQAVFR